MQRHWDEALRLVLAAVGAGSGAVAAVGCVESHPERARESDGNAGDPDGGKAPAPREPSLKDAGLGRRPRGDSSVMDSAASREGETSVNEAGVKTTRVPLTDRTCPSYPVALHTQAEGDVVAATCSAEAAAEYQADYACFDAPADGGTCDRGYVHSCVADAYQGGLFTRATFVCGPLRMADAGCCYVLTGSNAVGRPFLVQGTIRRAHAEAGPGWAARSTPDVSRLDGDTRRALADAYTHEAMAEHASVASFARFALQCLSCGAPAELVRSAHQAALEEVTHAELALGLATAYGGTELRPGRLDVRGALDGDLDPLRVAQSVAREGAIAETVSALVLAAARDAAEDASVRAILTRVAADELQHALLAWKYLRWAVDQGGDAVRAALAPIFASAPAHVGFGSVTRLLGDERAMRAHGYLPIAERRAVAEQALARVVAQAAEALLSRQVPLKAPTATGLHARPV